MRADRDGGDEAGKERGVGDVPRGDTEYLAMRRKSAVEHPDVDGPVQSRVMHKASMLYVYMCMLESVGSARGRRRHFEPCGPPVGFQLKSGSGLPPADAGFRFDPS